MTGQLFKAGAAGRQLGLLDKKRGKAVSDGKREAAALAHKAAVFLGKGRVAGVHRTAEQGEQILAEHHDSRQFKEENPGVRAKKDPACIIPAGCSLSKRVKRSREVKGVRTCWSPLVRAERSVILRKEVIQPQVPLRLPCYDLVPIDR